MIIPTQAPYIQQSSYGAAPISSLPIHGPLPAPIPSLPIPGPIPASIPLHPDPLPALIPSQPIPFNPNYQKSASQFVTPSPWNPFQQNYQGFQHYSASLTNIPPKPARQASYDGGYTQPYAQPQPYVQPQPYAQPISPYVTQQSPIPRVSPVLFDRCCK